MVLNKFRNDLCGSSVNDTFYFEGWNLNISEIISLNSRCSDVKRHLNGRSIVSCENGMLSSRPPICQRTSGKENYSGRKKLKSLSGWGHLI